MKTSEITPKAIDWLLYNLEDVAKLIYLCLDHGTTVRPFLVGLGGRGGDQGFIESPLDGEISQIERCQTVLMVTDYIIWLMEHNEADLCQVYHYYYRQRMQYSLVQETLRENKVPISLSIPTLKRNIAFIKYVFVDKLKRYGVSEDDLEFIYSHIGRKIRTEKYILKTP